MTKTWANPFFSWGEVLAIRIEMHFYATETPDGLIHVQNFVTGLRGQHHVHDKESFERWKKGIKREFLHYSKGTCDCGMKSGDVEEYDGQRWHNDKFEK